MWNEDGNQLEFGISPSSGQIPNEKLKKEIANQKTKSK
jgi:hypothetical protein